LPQSRKRRLEWDFYCGWQAGLRTSVGGQVFVFYKSPTGSDDGNRRREERGIKHKSYLESDIS
jgi:hypothetical protein